MFSSVTCMLYPLPLKGDLRTVRHMISAADIRFPRSQNRGSLYFIFTIPDTLAAAAAVTYGTHSFLYNVPTSYFFLPPTEYYVQSPLVIFRRRRWIYVPAYTVNSLSSKSTLRRIIFKLSAHNCRYIII